MTKPVSLDPQIRHAVAALRKLGTDELDKLIEECAEREEEAAEDCADEREFEVGVHKSVQARLRREGALLRLLRAVRGG